MQEKLVSQKKKYNKKNNFRINIFFNENGEKFEKVIERTFGIYCQKNK